MDIKLNAYRINNTETTVFISFSQIKNDNFQLVGRDTVTNSKGHIGVVFHLKNENGTTIQDAGNDSISFKADFKLDTNTIRVFYWNDEGNLADNLQCFRNFMEENDLKTDVKIGDFDCQITESNNKAIIIPRQSGNGGVLGIKNLP
jgi:hypothetical protein